MIKQQFLPEIIASEIEQLRKAFYSRTKYDREIRKYDNGYFAVGVLKKARKHYESRNIFWINIVIYDFEAERLITGNYFMTMEETEAMSLLLSNIVSNYRLKNTNKQMIVFDSYDEEKND